METYFGNNYRSVSAIQCSGDCGNTLDTFNDDESSGAVETFSASLQVNINGKLDTFKILSFCFHSMGQLFPL